MLAAQFTINFIRWVSRDAANPPYEDAVTEDILTEISRGLDQWLWFVEAHQQRKRGTR